MAISCHRYLRWQDLTQRNSSLHLCSAYIVKSRNSNSVVDWAGREYDEGFAFFRFTSEHFLSMAEKTACRQGLDWLDFASRYENSQGKGTASLGTLANFGLPGFASLEFLLWGSLCTILFSRLSFCLELLIWCSAYLAVSINSKYSYQSRIQTERNLCLWHPPRNALPDTWLQPHIEMKEGQNQICGSCKPESSHEPLT